MADSVLDTLRARFEQQRTTAERALDQIDDRAFFAALGPEANAPAVLVKHLAGNFRSRFTDFLTTDGNKPDRQRDREFEIDEADTREALMAAWADGWRRLDATLDGLTDADLGRTVPIRGEAHTVLDALVRALAHAAGHVGQIVLLARHAAGPGWRTLSIPRGESERYAHHPPPAP